MFNFKNSSIYNFFKDETNRVCFLIFIVLFSVFIYEIIQIVYFPIIIEEENIELTPKMLELLKTLEDKYK